MYDYLVVHELVMMVTELPVDQSDAKLLCLTRVLNRVPGFLSDYELPIDAVLNTSQLYQECIKRHNRKKRIYALDSSTGGQWKSEKYYRKYSQLISELEFHLRVEAIYLRSYCLPR